MDPDASILYIFDFAITYTPLSFNMQLGLIFIGILLCFSAIISGSKIAYFSLSTTQIQKIKKSGTKRAQLTLKHLKQPQLLLANILIGNNFVNIAIVVISSYISNVIFDFSHQPLQGTLFIVIVVTFLLLLFGEIIPKIYAQYFAKQFSLFMAYPLLFLHKMCSPFSSFLMKSSSSIRNKKIRKNYISMDDVSEALQVASENFEEEEKDFLEGIVKLKSIDVTTIMHPRVDIVAVDIDWDFSEVLKIITHAGYSRIPVYEESFDTIKGVLYVKDLLMHLQKPADFRWQSFIREPYIIPESKKIDDLLEEFQIYKVHLAIVVDEYGGTSGIVTLEDILEEIIGDIHDEFDDEDLLYTKINEFTYIFDGKISLHDVIKIYDLDDDFFEEDKGEADTLAGLILEITGDFPKLFEEIPYKNITFIIEAENKRRIKKIKTILHSENNT
ncbi:MAG: gliding motility-associated protein GldE [Bacteroidales bacterium]